VEVEYAPLPIMTVVEPVKVEDPGKVEEPVRDGEVEKSEDGPDEE
jgi:hypothetical protein